MRCLRTLLFTIAALLAVAWLVSRAGLTFTVERPGTRASLALAGRSLTFQAASLPPSKPLDRDRFTISTQTIPSEVLPSLLTLASITRTGRADSRWRAFPHRLAHPTVQRRGHAAPDDRPTVPRRTRPLRIPPSLGGVSSGTGFPAYAVMDPVGSDSIQASSRSRGGLLQRYP